MTDAVSAEQAVVALLRAMRACRTDLERFVIEAIWLGHDWPGEAGGYTYLDVGWGDDPVEFTVWSTLAMSFDDPPNASNEVQFRVSLKPSADRCRVESAIDAHLDVPMGRCGEGSHVLHRHTSEDLTLTQAIDVLPEHLLAIYRYDGYATDLGLTLRR